MSNSRSTPNKRVIGRPKKSDHAQAESASVEAQIVEQAKRLFRQQGFHGVSINDIVQAVGITKPTLYYYFKDKEALFVAVFKSMLSHGNRYITDGVDKRIHIREQLYLLSHGYLKNSPTSMTAMLRDTFEHISPEARAEIMQAHEQFMIVPFLALFETAKARGEINPKLDPRLLSEIFLSLLDTVTIRLTSTHGGREFDFDEAAKHYIDLLMDGICSKQ